jgi:hypothetical protein
MDMMVKAAGQATRLVQVEPRLQKYARMGVANLRAFVIA